MKNISMDGGSAGHMMRLQSVDVLRGIAAVMVVLLHIQLRASVDVSVFRTLFFWPLDFGTLGVTLFLVISGFCIHLAVARRIAGGQGKQADWAQFWKRRFFRLYPPYLAAIFFSLGVYFLLQAMGREDAMGLKNHHGSALGWDLLTHLLLIHNLFVNYCFALGNIAFWSLGLEEQLYALYALYLILRARWNVRRALLTVLTVSMVWNIVVPIAQVAIAHFGGGMVGRQRYGLGDWAPALMHWPMGYWFSWVLGAVAAEAYAGAIGLPSWCSQRSVALIFLVLSIVTNLAFLNRLIGPRCLPHSPELSETLKLVAHCVQWSSGPLFAVACFVLLNRWIARERAGQFQGWWVQPLAAVGLISYSLYLTHEPLLNLGEALLGLDRSVTSAGIRFAVYVPTCLAFAVFFYWAVERHFLHRPRAKLPLGPSSEVAVDVVSVELVPQRMTGRLRLAPSSTAKK